jgi:hypothetical protein
VKAVLVTALVAYLGACAFLWAMQERLIFLPTGPSPAPTVPPGWRLERVDLVAADGTRLEGALALPPAERPPLVLFFGGNAEEATSHLRDAARLYGQRAVLAVNYRGYGRSGGKPGEAALVADALTIHDWARARGDVDGARIAIHGRSLGSGVAVALAAARPVKALVLTSPFDSLAAVGAAHYPWVPVGLLLRHRFDGLSLAAGIRAPLLAIIASDDTIIAPAHSERLASAWGGPVQALRLAGRGHNDLSLDPLYGPAIAAFLDRRL